MDYLTSKKFIEEYFNKITDERLQEMKSIVNKYNSVGPTVEEYFGFSELLPRHNAHNPCKPTRKRYFKLHFTVMSEVENDIQLKPMNIFDAKNKLLITNAGYQYSQHSFHSCQISNC